MSRTTLRPGDLVMVDPVQPRVNPAPAQVAENGEDLFFQFNPKPWHHQTIRGHEGLTRTQAEEVLRGEREYDGGVLYKVWDEATQTAYAPPPSVLEEVERRQMAVEAAPQDDEPVNLGKIKPAPIDFDTPRDGLM